MIEDRNGFFKLYDSAGIAMSPKRQFAANQVPIQIDGVQTHVNPPTDIVTASVGEPFVYREWRIMVKSTVKDKADMEDQTKFYVRPSGGYYVWNTGDKKKGKPGCLVKTDQACTRFAWTYLKQKASKDWEAFT